MQKQCPLAHGIFGEAGFTLWQMGGGITAYGRPIEGVPGEAYIQLMVDRFLRHPLSDEDRVSIYLFDNTNEKWRRKVSARGLRGVLNLAEKVEKEYRKEFTA